MTYTIGIIGGTGEIGEGIAMRLSPLCDVVVGSRDTDKAETSCECCVSSQKERGVVCTVRGGSNQDALYASDIVILAIPFKHLVTTVESLHGFEDKIVISPINPMERAGHFIYTPPEEGSAAMKLAAMLPSSARVCTAFNNISGNRWRALDTELDYSVPVCGDDAEAKGIVMDLINRISLLKSYDAGPLSSSHIVESITPLLLNIARFNGMKDVGIIFR